MIRLKSASLQVKPKNKPMKTIFNLAFLFLVITFTSCNNGSQEKATTKSDTTMLTVMTFEKMADSCIDKPVVIEGTVLHTCKHGGKRMFLVDGSDSIRVEVTAGQEIAKFDEALIGSRVKVTGILKEERIDTKYLNEWEAEILKPEENHEAGLHSGAKGHEDQTKEDKLSQVNALREQLKSSGKDHLSFFSIEASSYKELK
jgi:hypothetical protein